MATESSDRREILELVTRYYKNHKKLSSNFEKGKTPVNYAGRVFDENEMTNFRDWLCDWFCDFADPAPTPIARTQDNKSICKTLLPGFGFRI